MVLVSNFCQETTCILKKFHPRPCFTLESTRCAIAHLSGAETALQEAWEEAGVRADAVHDEPIGQFTYDKILKDGSACKQPPAGLHRREV